ncbi:MAG: M48 family metallopeptidase [Mariprofundus sp.]|nr:M48 family metallopeptidase [Mariprofundus sp.]
MKDFFLQQEQAKRQTLQLLLLYMLAVIVIVLSVYFAIVVALFIAQFFQGDHNFFSLQGWWNPLLFCWVCGLTTLVIASGSLYRLHVLKQGGGRAVAEMVGGIRVSSATTADPLVRQLLNVVEEMAIASGLPVPPVYLLEQVGINAFAAGFTSSDAVITVTRGALDLLSRDQLQGVIAHEFSHVLNGDMRLKMRLMGILYGITLISDAGIMLLSSRRTLRYGKGKGSHPALMLCGFLLFLTGTAGAVLADLIKRAISRQREFLADAAAVQFTRNSDGIADALKVIGGYKPGSHISHPATQQLSHFFFGNAMNGRASTDHWATHPPLLERIRRLDPEFTGPYEVLDVAQRSKTNRNEAVASLVESGQFQQAAKQKPISPEHIVHAIGTMQCETALSLLSQLPDHLRRFARDPYTARAIVYGLLLDKRGTLRTAQLQALQKGADVEVFRELLDIQPMLAELDVKLRIPLLELLMPALNELSLPQYQQFKSNVALMIESNQQLSMFEFMLQRMLMTHLAPAFEDMQQINKKTASSEELVADVGVIVAMLVRLGAHTQPAQVFRKAMATKGSEQVVLRMPTLAVCSMARLEIALQHLKTVSPATKRTVIERCSSAIVSDGKVVASELEMLRAVCDALGCPMPLFR